MFVALQAAKRTNQLGQSTDRRFGAIRRYAPNAKPNAKQSKAKQKTLFFFFFRGRLEAECCCTEIPTQSKAKQRENTCEKITETEKEHVCCVDIVPKV